MGSQPSSWCAPACMSGPAVTNGKGSGPSMKCGTRAHSDDYRSTPGTESSTSLLRNTRTHAHIAQYARYLAPVAEAAARSGVDAAAESPAPAAPGATPGAMSAASIGDEGAGPPRAAHAAALNGPPAGGFTMLRYASAVSGRRLPSAPGRIASHRCITSRARQPPLLSQIATKWPDAGAWTVVETHAESQVSYSCCADATAFAADLSVGTNSMLNLTSARR